MLKLTRPFTCRCMMHAFSTTTASVMGHTYASGLITQAQMIVTFFRASHQPLALLKKHAHSMGIMRMLITPNKSRFTSVHASLESVVELQGVLQEIARQHACLLSKGVLNLINDDMLFVRLKQLSQCRLFEPFSLVIAAVQAASCTLVDVMRSLVVPYQGSDRVQFRWFATWFQGTLLCGTICGTICAMRRWSIVQACFFSASFLL